MLGRLAPVAAVLLLVAGCGGNSQRDQVASYLRQVTAAEVKLARPLQQVSNANQAFAKGGAHSNAGPKLAHARRTLMQLRGRLAAIPAPKVANHLRALLLELLDREIGLTDELRALSIFLPRFDADLHPLQAADLALKRELGQKASGKAASKALDTAKAQALDTYAATIGGVVARLRTLDPPGVWKPVYTSQLAALVQLEHTAVPLAAAINGGHAAAVPRLLRRFDAAAVADQSLADQRAQIAAVKTYNRRVKSVATIASAIAKERNRLQRVTS
jgi:outer membrane murein-binding lipoprotein Lpp